MSKKCHLERQASATIVAEQLESGAFSVRVLDVYEHLSQRDDDDSVNTVADQCMRDCAIYAYK